MRTTVTIMMMLLALSTAFAQNTKPKIVGQKELVVDQGQSITIQLTDLFVEEPDGQDNDNGNNGGPDGDNDDDDHDNDPDEDDEDQDSDDDDNGDDEGDDDDDDDDDDEKEGKGNNKGKDKKGDNDKTDGDKKDKGKNKSKGKDKGKGKSNGRQTYPEGYVLEIFSGPDYSFSGNTVTPHAAFSGALRVPIQVSNSKATSPKYDLKITVKPKTVQNIPPVITGQTSLSTPVNTSLPIKLSHLTVTDPDNQYPEGFSLSLLQGENYSISNATTVTPAKGFTGNLAVPVMVNDGKSNSQPFSLKIGITAVGNTAPKITGQVPLTISVNQSINLELAHLLVTDPDNEFPKDFTLKVFPDQAYAVTGKTVTPPAGFSGNLSVKVSVSDGAAESAPYYVQIGVKPDVNSRPLITGQVGIRIPAGQSLAITLLHLVVEDDDNKYPDDFTLSILEGANYVVAGQTITPVKDFLGSLSVGVKVHDGMTASDPFFLKAEVIAESSLEIIGQRSLEVAEDSSFFIRPQDVFVNDPSDTYPSGYSLKILDGENYNVRDNRVEPHRDFFGNLTMPVAVSKGDLTTEPFSLLVIVNPVNDVPELNNVETEPIVITNKGPWPLFDGTEVYDVDDSHLVSAEIVVDAEAYHRGHDQLEYEPSDSIHTVFDVETGVLFLAGRASLNEYQSIIRSVKYSHQHESDSLLALSSKRILVRLYDGEGASETYERSLLFESDVPLEIPTAFTPNNDQANDTWKITSVKNIGPLNTIIRVYDKKGIVVFEGQGLEQEWDGHFKGNPLPTDVYFYTIEMDLAYRRINYKGIVSILR